MKISEKKHQSLFYEKFLRDYVNSVFLEKVKITEVKADAFKIESIPFSNHLLEMDFERNFFLTTKDLEKKNYFTFKEIQTIRLKTAEYYSSFTVFFSVYYILFYLNSMVFSNFHFYENNSSVLNGVCFQNDLVLSRRGFLESSSFDLQWWHANKGNINFLGVEDVFNYWLRIPNSPFFSPLIFNLALNSFLSSLFKTFNIKEDIFDLKLFFEKYSLFFFKNREYFEFLVTRSFLVWRPFLVTTKLKVYYYKNRQLKFNSILDKTNALSLVWGYSPEVAKSLFFSLDLKLNDSDFRNLVLGFIKNSSRSKFKNRLVFFLGKTTYIQYQDLFLSRVFFKAKAWALLFSNRPRDCLKTIFRFSRIALKVFFITFASFIYFLYAIHYLGFWVFSGFSSFLSIQTILSVLAWIFLLVIYKYMKKPSVILEQLGFIGFIFYTEIFSFLIVLKNFRLDLVNLLIYELKIEYLLGYWVTFFISYLLFYPVRTVFSFLGSYVFNKLRDLYQYFLIKLKS